MLRTRCRLSGRWVRQPLLSPRSLMSFQKECFIVVDAGGGTIVSHYEPCKAIQQRVSDRHQDVVSYQVTGVTPKISIAKVSEEASEMSPGGPRDHLINPYI